MTDLERKEISLRAAESLVRDICCTVANNGTELFFYTELKKLETAIEHLKDCGKEYLEAKSKDDESLKKNGKGSLRKCCRSQRLVMFPLIPI